MLACLLPIQAQYQREQAQLSCLLKCQNPKLGRTGADGEALADGGGGVAGGIQSIGALANVLHSRWVKVNDTG